MKELKDTIEVKSLEGVEREVITAAFLEAFADYGLSLDAESLWDMFRRRGARMAMSFGAFAGDRLVSFVINGVGEHDGHLTAYDTGTGTIPSFRGIGLTDRIFEQMIPALQRGGVECYLLEVLQDNAPAVKIYTRQGFHAVRDFACFGALKADVEQAVARRLSQEAVSPVEIRRISTETLLAHGEERLARMLDYAPSWQNSLQSIARNPRAFACIVAVDAQGEIVGFAASETAYGDLSLIAVAPEKRRKGIATRLQSAMLPAIPAPRLKALNIDTRDHSTPHFLTATAFLPTATQHEMLRPL